MPAQEDLPKFSTESAREGMPNGWHFYQIAPYKKNTVYRLENYQGKTVLSANAKTSASGLAVKLKPRSANNLWLHWEWKALTAVQMPGDVIGIALLTDTDNTKSEMHAFYGDIELVRKNPK